MMIILKKIPLWTLPFAISHYWLIIIATSCLEGGKRQPVKQKKSAQDASKQQAIRSCNLHKYYKELAIAIAICIHCHHCPLLSFAIVANHFCYSSSSISCLICSCVILWGLLNGCCSSFPRWFWSLIFDCAMTLLLKFSLLCCIFCLFRLKFLTHVAFPVCIIFIITTENTHNCCVEHVWYHSKQYVLTL
mgnify:CR=1 FL=1